MKSHLYSLRSLAAVCLALALPLSQASAQKRTQPAAAQPAGNYDLEVINDSSGTYLLDGDRKDIPTLGRAIEILRRLHPELTFALSPGLGDVKLGELKLRAGDVDQTLEALRLAAGNRFVFATPSHMPDRNQDGMRSLYLLQGDEPRNRRRMVEAFNLGPWISGAASPKQKEQRFDQLQELINRTMERLKQSQLDAAERPEIMFHMDANVMVVIGGPEAIEVAGKLARALSPSPFMNYGSGAPGISGGSYGGGGIGGGSSLPPSQQPNPIGGNGFPPANSQSGGPSGSADSTAPAPNTPAGVPRQ